MRWQLEVFDSGERSVGNATEDAKVLQPDVLLLEPSVVNLLTFRVQSRTEETYLETVIDFKPLKW